MWCTTGSTWFRFKAGWFSLLVPCSCRCQDGKVASVLLRMQPAVYAGFEAAGLMSRE